jgi:hypothetical protein
MKFSKYKWLFPKSASNITRTCIFSVVTSCDELEHFDFSGCDLVSNATVQAALASVKLRTNNIKVTMVVGGELNHSVMAE